ncbi:AAA family ATPase [Verrucomicrobiales bacterium]|nr:AAA family ATPase [Verrucomicrobiales bacterium]
MPHITNIRIKHFWALKSVEFAVGKMGVLIGENDVGKTSVLNAFYANKKLADPNDFHQHDCDTPVVFTLTFDTDGRCAVIRQTFQFDKVPVCEVFEGGGISRRTGPANSSVRHGFAFSP